MYISFYCLDLVYNIDNNLDYNIDMETTTLATFRIDKKTWKKFKKWVGEKNSNASAELNQFVLRSLGLIDENLDTENNNALEQRIDSYLDNNLEQRIEKAINIYLDINIDKYIDKVNLRYRDEQQNIDIDTNAEDNLDISIDSNIDEEKPKAESLQEESNEQLTHAELARRMNVSPATVSRWANGKRQPPLDLEWRYDAQLKKWVK